MYSTCLFCHRPLGTNESIEHFPVGRRLAFDGRNGRLWVICRTCTRWNLSALEERWEAMEECDRLFRETKLRVSTTNIGLARLSEGLELVRIGSPQRPEMAAWRYGEQFGRRWKRSWVLGGASAAGVYAVLNSSLYAATVGAVPGSFLLAFHLYNRFTANHVVARVDSDGGRSLTIRKKHLELSALAGTSRQKDGWRLCITTDQGFEVLDSEAALKVLRHVLARINRQGAPQPRIRRAVERLEIAGSPDRLLSGLANTLPKQRWHEWLRKPETRPYQLLTRLPVEDQLALEMAVNEESERTAMEGELQSLEQAWREAEEIAAIADRLVVPESVRRALERIRTGTPLA
jgi:hypothetical protein